jgi:hypothetical protein
MKHAFLVAAFLTIIPVASFGQTSPSVKRTIVKTDQFNFSSGGTVAITGAPNGSIQIVGSNANEIEINAEIHLEAGSEKDLDTLAASTGFITDESTIRTSIITVGNNNKFGQKKMPKGMAKELLSAPFTVNYVIRVPRYSDLEVDGGTGDLTIKGVEGSIRANFLESNVNVEIIGGTAAIAVGKGNADISFGVRGWRGRAASIQVAEGDLTVRLPSTLSAEIDANVVRSGAIENGFPDLKPRDRKTAFTEKLIVAKAGVGGGSMKFSVGTGKLRIETLRSPL